MSKKVESNIVAIKEQTEYEKLINKLDAKIPRDVISKREAGNGRTLDYLEGWYVIARLNELFGQGNWGYVTDEMRNVYAGPVEGRYGTTHSANYVAKVTVWALGTSFTDYGYGDGSDKVNPGKAHELAVKEAVTDGIKRAAKNLGMSMGLALYDKTQENVSDAESEHKNRAGDIERTINNQPRSIQSVTRVASQPTSTVSETKRDTGTATKPEKTREEINMLISSTSRVIIKKELATTDVLKTTLKDKYGVDSKEALTDTQATEFLTYLNKTLGV